MVPDPKEPFEILNINVLHGVDFRYSIKKTEIDGEKAYEFLIENTRTSPGRYLDQINILTDKTERNPVTIKVSGNIKPVEPAMPDNGAAPVVPLSGIK